MESDSGNDKMEADNDVITLCLMKKKKESAFDSSDKQYPLPYNEDLNNSKSRSKELMVEKEEEQKRQAIRRKGLAWVL
jgi:hypothetical protein